MLFKIYLRSLIVEAGLSAGKLTGPSILVAIRDSFLEPGAEHEEAFISTEFCRWKLGLLGALPTVFLS